MKTSVEVDAVPRVAHAGGGVNERRYTNSLEAIEHTLSRGIEWIEVDFNWTSDGELVCIHDWGDTFRGFFRRKVSGPVTLAEFEEGKNTRRFTLLTLADLARVMEEHPKLTVVTDVKENNLTALKIFADELPESERRVVPQVYQPGEYELVKALGYEKMIWTLYDYSKQRDIDRVLQEVLTRDFYAVCMPRHLAKAGHALRLGGFGVSTYVHTINDPEEWRELREKWGVTQVYTDFLPAED